MGNCSGLFADCTGQGNDQAVRKIDENSMKAALAANKEAQLHGNAIVANDDWSP